MKRALLLVALWAVSAGAAPAPAPDAFQKELQSRHERWKREAKKPEGVLAVLGALELWTAVAPRDVAKFLDQAAATRAAHPLAQAHAAYLAATAAAKLGEPDRAAAARARLGIVERWSVIGPFGFEGGDNLGTAFGPEEGIHDKELGKRGEVAWRAVAPALIQKGVVSFGAMLRPDTQAAGYALTYVHSDARRDVAVRVGSTGRIKVWVGGRLALTRDVPARPVRLDQDAGAARLEKGWNAVLVKVVVDDGPWAFLLRVTTLDGKPLPLAAELAPPAAAVAAAGAPKGKPAELRALLEGRARRAKGKAREAAWRDVALYLAHVAPDHADGKPVETALGEAGATRDGAEAATYLAAARFAETPDVRRRAAERAAAAKGARPEEVAAALVELGAYYVEEALQPRRARELWTRALEVDPTCWPAAIRLAGHLAVLELEDAATARVEAVVAERPAALRARRSLAGFERRRGRPAEAQALLEKILAEDRDDASLYPELATLAHEQGDDGAARGWLERYVAARPDIAGAYLALADFLLDDEDLTGAVAAFDAGLAVAPDDPELLEVSGRALTEKGNEAQRADGIARLRRSLAVHPQNPDLRRYLARVVPASDADLERRYARDAKKIIDRHQGWNEGADPATVLLDLKVTRVHDNGLSEVFVQRLIRIEDEQGAQTQSEQGAAYSPATQAVEIRAARVWKASGEVVEANQQDTRELSEPWYGLYYDVRAEVVGFERLEPGDVVEVSWVLADTGRRNLFADYYGDLHFLAESVARAEVEYTLLGPQSREFYVWASAMDGLKRETDTVDGERRWRFTASRVPKVTVEGGMPGWSEVAPYVHVSTYRSWEQVARWYWNLVKDQLASDDTVKKAAQEAVAGLTGELEKVRAIHGLVLRSTRYVGLEFGIHSFKPYRVPLVYARKFGDCKDKASLIVVMLREVGIPANLVLVRTRRNGDLEREPASLAVFDHAIAYVPSLDLYLDGTAEWSGSGELPAEDQGVTVLVIDGGDGRLTQTPILAAERNRLQRSVGILVEADGSAKLTEDVIIEGQAAPEWRRFYQSPGDRRDRYEKAWNAAWAGARVDRVVMPSLAEIEKPVTVHAEGSVPEVGAAVAGGRTLPATGRPSELARSYARTSKRQHDLVLDYPWIQEESVTWALAGATVRTLPRPVQLTSPFGSFELTVTTGDASGMIVVAFTLRIDHRRIAKGDYAAWREFLVAVDAALNQSIVLEVTP